MTYYVQYAYVGGGWKHDTDEICEDLDDAKDAAHGMDSMDGKYTYRVIDDDGVPYCELLSPYEGIRVDIRDPEVCWLADIQMDYGIPADVFRAACLDWLERNPEHGA